MSNSVTEDHGPAKDPPGQTPACAPTDPTLAPEVLPAPWNGDAEAPTLAPAETPAANVGSVTRTSTDSAPPTGEPEKPFVPGYEILEVLGRGGMGVVYKARQLSLNRLVALKMILAGSHAGPQDLARFRTEAEAVAQLQHPNIVQIYEIAQQAGLPYFSLEYVSGGSLAEYLDGTPLAARPAAALLETLAHAVHAAHKHGIVHRDLKPANILLEGSGARGQGSEKKGLAPDPRLLTPKIADFGLAKRLQTDQGQTQSGSIMGTPSYMAPEQAAGKTRTIGPAADIYALGAILYELLTGRPPFRAETSLDTVLQVISDEPVPPRRLQPKVPHDLETICLKCLHKEPSKRYATAEELANDLRRFLEDRPIVARPAGRLERGWRWCKRNRAVAISLASVALALLAGSVASSLFGIQAQHNAEEARRLADVAREEKAHAETAANDARRAEQHATEQEQRARQTATRLQRNLYDVQINQARKNLDSGFVGIALEQLEKLRPGPGEPDLRGFEWYHLYRRCLPADHQVLYGSGFPVNAVAWSPDGKWLASAAGVDIRLWNTHTGQTVRVLGGHQRQVYRVCFSPDGTKLASAAADGTLRLWRVANGRELHMRRTVERELRCVAWRPDGKQIAAIGVGGKIELWDAATGKARGRLDGPQSPTMSLAYSPDGKQLLTGSDNKKICLWDATSGKLVRTFLGHTEPIYEVTFSPDGKLIGSASADATARLWTVATGTERLVLHGHGGFVRGIAFNPTGTRLATACDDHLIRLWETGTGKLLHTFAGHENLIWTVAFQAAGKKLASASEDQTVRIWSAEEEPGIRRITGGGLVAFTPDSRQLGTLALFGHVMFRDLEHDRQGLVLSGHWGEVVRLVPSWDRRYFATLGATDRTARLWDAATGKCLLVVRHHDTPVLLALALDPACKYLATSGNSNQIHIWDATPSPDSKERTRPLHVLRSPSRIVLGLAFSPDSRLLASADGDGVLRLWDTYSGKLMRECPGAGAQLWTVAFHPSGREIATAGNDRQVTIWETATGKKIRVLHGFPQRVIKLAYSPDGERLFTLTSDIQRLFAARDNSPGEIKIWDAQTGEELFADSGFARAPWEMAFSPDGRKLAIGFQGTIFEKGVLLYEAPPAAENTREWSTLYQSPADRSSSGPTWKATTGQWSMADQAWQGVAADNGRLVVDLAGLELPDTVEVGFEFWMPRAGSCDIRLLDRDARHGIGVRLPQGANAAGNSEVTFAIVDEPHNPRIGGAVVSPLEPGRHHHVRLVRQGRWLALWIDGREVAGAVASDQPLPLLRLQANPGHAGDSFFIGGLEIRAPRDAVRLRQLRSRVEGLWAKSLLRERVRGQVRVAKDLSTDEKTWCLGLVDHFAEDPDGLNAASWETVCKPGRAADKYALALQQAQAACKADPDNSHYLAALGLAQMRVGHLEQSLVTLQHAVERTQAETGLADPACHAGLALAYQRLGRTAAAREHLHRVCDLLRGEITAQEPSLAALRTEATALIHEPETTAQDAEAIKDLVLRVPINGWLRHDLRAYLAAYTDDCEVRTGRAERHGPYDVVLGRQQLEVLRRLEWQGPVPPPTTRMRCDNVEVQVQGRHAELRCRVVVQSLGGYEAYGCRYELRRSPGGWRIARDSSWIVEKKQEEEHTVYTTPTWARLDAEVARLARKDDVVGRIGALKDAYRMAEAYRLACELTNRKPANARAWSLRGEMAVLSGATRDIRPAFHHALALDPDVEVPWYITRQRLVRWGPPSGVPGLAFHPDGRRIVSGAWDKSVRLWDSTNGQELRQFVGHENGVRCAAFSPNGKVLATGSMTLRLWDVETGQSLHVCKGHTGVIYRLAFSPDSKRIVTASADHTARIWDVGNGKQLQVLADHTDEVLGAAFSPDGRWLATASHDSTIRLWDARTYAPVRVFQGHRTEVKRVEFSPDSKHLASSSADQTVRVWNVATGRAERIIRGHAGTVDVVQYSPDGRWLATGDEAGTVRIWEAASGKLRHVMRGHESWVYVLSFRPDGRVLASGAADGVRLWDLGSDE